MTFFHRFATPVAILLLAAATVFHAATMRYSTTAYGRLVIRTDRLTGTVWTCRISPENAADCGTLIK